MIDITALQAQQAVALENAKNANAFEALLPAVVSLGGECVTPKVAFGGVRWLDTRASYKVETLADALHVFSTYRSVTTPHALSYRVSGCAVVISEEEFVAFPSLSHYVGAKYAQEEGTFCLRITSRMRRTEHLEEGTLTFVVTIGDRILRVNVHIHTLPPALLCSWRSFGQNPTALPPTFYADCKMGWATCDTETKEHGYMWDTYDSFISSMEEFVS